VHRHLDQLQGEPKKKKTKKKRLRRRSTKRGTWEVGEVVLTFDGEMGVET
jgi:hypothetical protein